MNEEYAVVLKNVSKCYKMYSGSKERLKDFILPGDYGTDFYALRNLNLSIKKGSCVGLIGLNGSGKSTLANMIAGISMPTSGEIYVNGKPAIIAISSGLNKNLTGIENIELKGLMIGLSLAEIENLKKSIMDFADIGRFIYQPVKTYSSGMKARLGFAISVNINPDILVIDEALSVGDMTFSQKCLNKMNEFREKGKTIFFVSHSVGQMKSFCNEILWLEYGRKKAYGATEDVMPMYESFVKTFNKMSEKEKKAYKEKVLQR